MCNPHNLWVEKRDDFCQGKKERESEIRNMQPKHRNTNSHALSEKRTFYVQLCEWDVIRSGTWD